MTPFTSNHERVTAAITDRLPGLTAGQARLAARAAMAALATCAAAMAVDAAHTHLARLAFDADAQAHSAERGFKTTTGQWRREYYEQDYPDEPQVYQIRQQIWEQVAAWLRGPGQVSGRHVLVDAVALKAVTDYLTVAGASATVHAALAAAGVWQTQKVYQDTTYTNPRPLAGCDVVEGDQVAYARGRLARGMRQVIEQRDLRWLLVERVLVDGTAGPGVHLPQQPEPYLLDGDEPVVVRIPASQSTRLH